MSTDRPPRESATVVLVRDGAAGLEVFMVRRHLNSDFVGGAYVFPGGGLDAADAEPAVLARYQGVSPEAAGAALQLAPDRALAHWGAAIRETFEEAGVLLAWPLGAAEAPQDEATHRHLNARRQALLDGTLDWPTFLATENMALACERLHYFAHWVTPEGTPKRFTTRFFLAVLPAGQRPLADDREVEAGVWLRPMDALEAYARQELTLIFPTLKTLEDLAKLSDAASAVAWCGTRVVVTMLPRIVERAGEPVVLLPGDAGYAEALGANVAFDPSRVRGR